MLGRTVSDPENTEGGGSLRGLGLLPVDTVFHPRKITVQARGVVGALSGVFAGLSGAAVEGYEIHMGDTTRDADAQPFCALTRADGTEVSDGCQAENAYGTYLHGVFDAPGVALELALAARKGVSLDDAACDTAEYKEREYDRLADTVRQALDMDLIYRILEGNA